MRERWKRRAQLLEREVRALWLAYRDPRVPWYAKAFAACVVGYALSPLDLIPDTIPILGLLDDAVLVPLGLLVARRLIPERVMAECRERASLEIEQGLSIGRVAAVVVVALWLLAAAGTVWLAARFLAPARR